MSDTLQIECGAHRDVRHRRSHRKSRGGCQTCKYVPPYLQKSARLTNFSVGRTGYILKVLIALTYLLQNSESQMRRSDACLQPLRFYRPNLRRLRDRARSVTRHRKTYISGNAAAAFCTMLAAHGASGFRFLPLIDSTGLMCCQSRRATYLAQHHPTNGDE